MSGGHWNGDEWKCSNFLEEFAEEGHIGDRFPEIAKIFGNLAKVIYYIVKKIDYDICGDSSIPNDRIFTKIALPLLLVACVDTASSNFDDTIDLWKRRIASREEEKEIQERIYRDLLDSSRKDDCLSAWHKACDAGTEIHNLKEALILLEEIREAYSSGEENNDSPGS